MTAPETVERSTKTPRPEYTLGLLDFFIDATVQELEERSPLAAQRLDENRLAILERLQTILPSVAAVYGTTNTVSRSVEQASAAVVAMALMALVTEMTAEATSDGLGYRDSLTLTALLQVTEHSASPLYRTLGEPVQPAPPAADFEEMAARGWLELEAFVGRRHMYSDGWPSSPAEAAPAAGSVVPPGGLPIDRSSEAVKRPDQDPAQPDRAPGQSARQQRAGRWLNAALLLGVVAFLFPAIGMLPIAAVAVNVRAWFLAPIAGKGQWRVVLGSLLALFGFASYLVMYGHI